MLGVMLGIVLGIGNTRNGLTDICSKDFEENYVRYYDISKKSY